MNDNDNNNNKTETGPTGCNHNIKINCPYRDTHEICVECGLTTFITIKKSGGFYCRNLKEWKLLTPLEKDKVINVNWLIRQYPKKRKWF